MANTPPDSAGSGTGRVATLITLGLALLAVYVFLVPEGSSALHARHTTSGRTKMESIPGMAELDSLPYTDSDGSEQRVSVLNDCSDKKLGEKFREVFGIPKEKISDVVQQRPKTFCRSILQHWYLEGSFPPSAYPINWIGLLKAMNAVGLSSTAKHVTYALSRFVNSKKNKN